MVVRTRKLGGSLMVTIPKEIVKELNLKENELVELNVRKPKKSYLGILKDIPPFTEKDRFDYRSR